MKIGLWNIDHPETASCSDKKEQRFQNVLNYLMQADCDAYVLGEANAAIQLPGYCCELSEESPFKSSRRFCSAPNVYHQVAIYNRRSLERIEVADAVNGLRCSITDTSPLKELYGNVITIKDQWKESSSKTYFDRLKEQIQAIRTLPDRGVVVAGDFNLRLGWPQKRFAHCRVKEDLAAKGWVWATKDRDDTVQHVLHSSDLKVTLTVDHDVKYGAGGLSDHPFVEISVARGIMGG